MSCNNVNTTGSTTPGSAEIDFFLAVAKGDFTGYSRVSKFGYNPTVGSLGYESVWEESNAYPWPSSAGAVTVSSSSTNDTNSSGTGARTVSIEGLDASHNPLSETVNMNGTSNVTTSGLFFRVFRMTVITAGSLETNDGKITATIGGTTIATITAGNGQTLMAVYTVPAGKTAYIVNFNFSSSKDQEMDYRIRTKNGAANAAWQIKEFVVCRGGFNDFVKRAINSISEKTDVDMQATSQSTSTASGGFELILIDN